MNIGGGLPLLKLNDSPAPKAPAQSAADSAANAQASKAAIGAGANFKATSKDTKDTGSKAKSAESKSDSTFSEKLSQKTAGTPEQKGAGKTDAPKSVPVENKDQNFKNEVSADTGIVKKVATRANQQASGQIEPLTKEQAMQTFLDRMQSELGVEPSDVLAAFSQLDEAMLMAKPEESAEQFLDNLDLDPASRDEAMLMYSDLLTWRSTADLSQNLKTQGQSAQLEVLSQDQLAKRDRIENLNNLSDRFFMMGDYGRGAKLANSMPKAVRAYGQANEAGLSMQSADKMAPPALQAAADGASAGAIDIQGMQPVAEQAQMPMDMSQLQKLAQSVVQSSDRQMPMNTEGQFKLKDLEIPASGAPDADLDAQINALKSLTSPNVPKANLYNSGSQSGMGGMQLDSDSEGESDDAEIAGSNFSGQMDTKLNQATAQKNFAVGTPTPTSLDMSENIREVIRGAQVMAKNGGGEMKVKLSPEGMGDLHLKVMVQNGEVKVEMVTSSDETKKILEKGLSELKQSLSAHKLNVEHIKIETAQGASDQMMKDRQDQADRGFQQRFLQDFRDQNSGRRFEAMGINSAHGLGSQKNDPAGNDMNVSDDRRKRLERRLDLVA